MGERSAWQLRTRRVQLPSGTLMFWAFLHYYMFSTEQVSHHYIPKRVPSLNSSADALSRLFLPDISQSKILCYYNYSVRRIGGLHAESFQATQVHLQSH